MFVLAQEPLSLWKADIASAFRIVPIKPQHREYAAIIFMLDGVTYISVHRALPFGSVASVHGWDRIGEPANKGASCIACTCMRVKARYYVTWAGGC